MSQVFQRFRSMAQQIVAHTPDPTSRSTLVNTRELIIADHLMWGDFLGDGQKTELICKQLRSEEIRSGSGDWDFMDPADMDNLQSRKQMCDTEVLRWWL